MVDPTMTIDDAIALAGGASENGNLQAVSLIRDGAVVADALDVTRSVAGSVQSGDQVFVPKTSWLSRHGAALIAATISAIGIIVAFTN